MKEWKSYANLHAFDTENVAIVEGLIWTAIAAAALKRFLAHLTQLLMAVPMSTRKVAMCAVHVLGDIVQALQSGDVPRLYAAMEAAVTYLACHAQRAHPKRDRHLVHSQVHFVAYDFCRSSQILGLFWLSMGTEEIILTKH